MLTVLSALPEGLLDVSASDLRHHLTGPTLTASAPDAGADAAHRQERVPVETLHRAPQVAFVQAASGQPCEDRLHSLGVMRMNTLDLYSTSLCPFAHRVRIVISEKLLPAHIVAIDLHNKPADFLAMPPEGKVPVLRHGACSVWDSTVINEYLDDAFPTVAMMPRDAVARARARTWIRFADARLYEHTSQMLHSRDPAVHARSLAAIEQDLLYLEEHALAAPADGLCDGETYWMGAAFTLVDATFYPWFEQFAVLQAFFGLRWPEHRLRLAHWRQTVADRPSVAAIAQPAEFYLQRYGALLEARLSETS
jgi:glutathione S-transferase